MFWEEGIFCRKPRSHKQIPQNHPAPAGAKPISCSRCPRCMFALQCDTLYRDIADSMAELQKGIDDFSALASANAQNA